MKPVIAVPYFPGSNGDYDAINRIKEFGMEPLPLYFHIGNAKRLEENSRLLIAADGVVIPGGFPYEDRVGFGIIPARIQAFARSIRAVVDSGKPVIAFCSGNQIASALKLAFPAGSPYGASLLPNICDRNGDIVHEGFLDGIYHTRLACPPERTAFTRLFNDDEVIPSIMDHGGGRFWADRETLDYLLANGMVVTQYCDRKGVVEDNFPTNPNGSMLNIESITNRRGNLKIGMSHNERKINALRTDVANLVFQSMREYIEKGCPDLQQHAVPQNIPVTFKDYGYLSQPCDKTRTLDVYVKMLTDDNERMTAQIFVNDVPLERRRLLRMELSPDQYTPEGVQQVLMEVAKLDLYHGVMLKKDLPMIAGEGVPTLQYEVVSRKPFRREFVEHTEIAEGFPIPLEQISLPNPGGYCVRRMLWRNPFLRDAVTNVHSGRTWFFRTEQEKQHAVEVLLG